MVKSSSTKLMRLVGLLLSLTLLCFTYACSNDAESVESGTEVGAAAHGVHIDSFTGAADAVYSGQSIIMTAYVTDSANNPVDNADVYFQFTTNTSGASLKSLGGQTGESIKVTTDKGGQAQVVYKAGGNSTAMELNDIVSAVYHASKMAFMITRVAGGSQGLIISVTADQDSLKAGENTIIKAKVTNATGVVIGGQAVTFTLAENNSGATLRTLGTGVTDAGGEASAVYKAGATSPTKSIQDTVQAAVPDAAGAVFITRLANTAIIGCRLTLTADRTSLEGGKSTILRATALNGDGKPYTGNIKFEFLTNSSSGTLSPSSAQTNSNGVATTVYKAGVEGSGAVEDIIKASATQCCTGDDCCTETLCCTEAGCCSETIIITRTGQAVVTPTGYRIAVTAEKTSLTAGETTLVTATVTTGSGSPAQGQTVSFSFAASPSGGALSTISGTTDASGKAIAGYTAGSNMPTVAVQDIIQASVTGATGAIILTRTASSATGLVLTLTATPDSVYLGSMSELTAKLAYSDASTAGAGVVVTFTLEQNQSTATLTNGTVTSTTTVTGVTDGNGEAKITYIAGNTTPTLSLQDSIKASVTDTGANDRVFITRSATPDPGNYIITLEQDPATSSDNRVQSTDSSFVKIKAKVTLNGEPVTSGSINFSKAVGAGSLVSIPPDSAALDGNGEAEATFILPAFIGFVRIDETTIQAEFNGIYVFTYVYWVVRN